MDSALVRSHWEPASRLDGLCRVSGATSSGPRRGDGGVGTPAGLESRVRADRWAHALSAAGADAARCDGGERRDAGPANALARAAGGTCRRPLPLPPGVKPPRSKIHGKEELGAPGHCHSCTTGAPRGTAMCANETEIIATYRVQRRESRWKTPQFHCN